MVRKSYRALKHFSKPIHDNNKSVRAILTNYLSCILLFSLIINCTNCYFASLLLDKIHLLVSSKLLYHSRFSNDKIFDLDKQHKKYTPSRTSYYDCGSWANGGGYGLHGVCCPCPYPAREGWSGLGEQGVEAFKGENEMVLQSITSYYDRPCGRSWLHSSCPFLRGGYCWAAVGQTASWPIPDHRQHRSQSGECNGCSWCVFKSNRSRHYGRHPGQV